MSQSPYSVDVTSNNFSTLVVEKSHHVPVMVDFWAAWCQPCQMLMPVLAQLAEQGQGIFVLAKVNADEEQALATQHGVRGLPTVKVFRDGRVVEELVGVQPESAYRAAIERYRSKPSDRLLQRAETAWQAGNRKQALELLRAAQAAEPDNPVVKIALVEKLLLDNDSLDTARELLESLPMEQRQEQRIMGLSARLEFAKAARGIPDPATLEAALAEKPDDCRLRFDMGVLKVVAGDYEAALQQFLSIMGSDPRFGDGLARKSLVAVFNILGGDDPLVAVYRRKMTTLLY